jgi:hypothetical protein
VQKTLTVNGKRFASKQIVKIPNQITRGDDYKVVLNGFVYFWNYRQIQDEYFAPVCDPDEANAIALMPDDGTYKYSIWMPL